MNIDPALHSYITDLNAALTRRQFFRQTATGLGVAALSSLLGPRALGASDPGENIPRDLWKIAPRAKRAIYISLIGAPSQIDLFDYKPDLQTRFKEDLKDWLKKQGERLTGMTDGKVTLPLAPSVFKLDQHGDCGTWLSDLLREQAKEVDALCTLRL